MKIFRSKKALSPVVASIILIAVTVAVSIAVAAWMGALTFTFMGTEELKVTNMQFPTGGTSITLTVNNTGTTPVTINEVWVNGAKKDFEADPSATVAANTGCVITITCDWDNGANYQAKLVTSKGNQFLYSAVAPS